MTSTFNFFDSESIDGEYKRATDLVNYQDGFTFSLSSADNSDTYEVTHEYTAEAMSKNPLGAWESYEDEDKEYLGDIIYDVNVFSRSAWDEFGFIYDEMFELKGQENIDELIDEIKDIYSSEAEVTVEFIKLGDTYILRGNMKTLDEEEGLLEISQEQILRVYNGRPAFASYEIIYRCKSFETRDNSIIEFTYLDSLPDYNGPKKPNQ